MSSFFVCRSWNRKEETDSLTVFFALSRSLCVKAACRTLMKLTPARLHCSKYWTVNIFAKDSCCERYSFFNTYRAFHGFGQAKFANCSFILGYSQFSILSQLPLKTMLDIKVVKINLKIIILFHKPKCLTHSVPELTLANHRKNCLFRDLLFQQEN